MVLAFAFVMNYSGMLTTMALVLANTEFFFPFFSPVLGWLGAFLAGFDTSSSALFGTLQQQTDSQLGLNETLMVANNASGGVTCKMISPQSIAVACTATGIAGKEAGLFRFTFKHSIMLICIIIVIVMSQAYIYMDCAKLIII